MTQHKISYDSDQSSHDPKDLEELAKLVESVEESSSIVYYVSSTESKMIMTNTVLYILLLLGFLSTLESVNTYFTQASISRTGTLKTKTK